MLALVKIRLIYLKRKKCVLFFSYLLIPIIIFISTMVYLAQKNDKEVNYRDKKIFNYEYENQLFESIDSMKEYNKTLGFLKVTSLISKNEEKGKDFQLFLKNKLDLDVPLYQDEKSANKNSVNLIIINYDEKEQSYKFSFKQNRAIELNDTFYENFYRLYPFIIRASEEITDIFSYYDFIYIESIIDTTDNTDDENILDNLDISDNPYISPDYFYNPLNNFNEQIDCFLLYQSLISRFLIEKEKGISRIEKNIHFKYAFNSYPKIIEDQVDFDSIGAVFSYIIDIQYTLIFLSFGIQILEEKEQKLKKLLDRQGIGEVKYILSLFFNYLLVGLITDVVLIIAMIIIMQSLKGLFILNIILYIIAQFPLMYLIVIICSTKKNGIILINIICFSTLVVGFILQMGGAHRQLQLALNIFPNINEFSILKIIFKYEKIGIYSSDLLKLKYKKVSYIDDLIMFFVEICLYSLICFIIISYQNSGLPFWDFIQSFCTKVNRKINLDNNEISSNNEDNKGLEKNHEELSKFNIDLKNNNEYLNIKNITKIYGDLRAVNNFNGEIFKNEIFCLLGHNGAGKTTLIKMISGIEDPDNGDIFLNNISIITNKNYLYRNIGLCQQEDILFEHLTVEEHLRYMMEIKGSNSDEQQINLFIHKIDLNSKRGIICKHLSGGEKRKLCIALALIGNSQLVLLDEPTSGMDVIAKRKLWAFLKEFKNNKIIILTTHSLDEAEYLGDRIGIMSGGEFICSGTSSYLKSKYPCGFNLNLLINSEIFDNNKKKELYQKFIKYEPNLEVKISSKGIFSVNIASNSKHIKEIFDLIEESKEEFGIEDYTVSSTSLEDVFLKLNHRININEENGDLNNDKIIVNDDINTSISSSSFISQLFSHIKRGFFSIWRNKILFILEIIIGLFILYIYVLIEYTILDQISETSLSFVELFENNDIYICKEGIDFFKDSYVYDDLCSIKLKEVDKKNNISEFIEEVYQNSIAHIGKSSLCLKSINSNIYEIYNSEISIKNPGYILANIMLSVSAFLKKEYDIKASIFYEIIDIESQDIGESGINISEMSTMFSLCFACIISICIYLGSIISEKIKERIKNIKHILYLSGSNIWSYWGGFYVVDLIKLFIFSTLASASLYIINSFASLIWIDLIITSFSSLCFIYFLSFILYKEESGQKSLLIIVFSLIIIFAVIIIITITTKKKVNLDFFMNKYNFTFFDITPITSFLLSYLRLVLSYTIFNGEFFKDLEEYEIPIFGKIYRPKVYILTSLMVQVINLVFYFCLIILFESTILEQFFNCLKVKLMREQNFTFSNPQINEGIISNNNNNIIKYCQYEENINSNEKINIGKKYHSVNKDINTNNFEYNNYIDNEIDKIQKDNENKLTTKIIGLKKTYWVCCGKNIRAINNLYLGLENNEKFGLLGFNGSGKSTTFKTITKEILYDKGSIYLFGKNTKTEFEEIRNSIGYCPQENPIFDYMKVREIISFYLEMKKNKETTENICERFGLSKFIDTYCINLSGGNKRKLSFAIALICKPKLLLLDEPSTGVDPESRRIMWKNIMELNKNKGNFNMILTTHSIEEAEVLCDTVSWLKSGNFISIGNPEKLKIAFSAGYKLNIKFVHLNQSNEDMFQKSMSSLSNVLKNFNILNAYTLQIENIRPYIIELEKIINNVKDKCEEIVFQELNKDFSFEFKIRVLKQRQSDLFVQVLDMKNTNNLLSEISISMESLENILTKL